MHTNRASSPTRLAGLFALLIALVATLTLVPITTSQATSFDRGYPKMGSQSEAQAGFYVKSHRSIIRTTLFPVQTKKGAKSDLFAYCVELSVGAYYGIDLNVDGWSKFPGQNNFAKDDLVKEKAAWIAYNSYPNKPLDELIAKTGLSGLTAEEAITATQAAIWTLTDGAPASSNFEYNGFILPNKKAPSRDQKHRVDSLFSYLLGEANTGRPEVLEPNLSVTVGNAEGNAGNRVGPIAITASEDTVTVVTDSPYPLVDADGNAVDLNAVPGNAVLYVDVPADAQPGSANVSVELTGSKFTGQLITGKYKRTQTLIISDSEKVTEAATGVVTWGAGPSLATSASNEETGGKFVDGLGPATIVDVVSYTGLTSGQEYTVTGELMVRDNGEAISTGITASQTFTPDAADGSVTVTFDITDADLAGKTVVAFEVVTQGKNVVATHEDILDENQTVYSPLVETDAYDLTDSDQILSVEGGTLRDRIEYSGVQTGQTYIVRGEVMDKDTGESTGITGETAFQAGAESGVVDVDFEIPADHAGKTLVVFERLYVVTGDAGNTTEELIAVHEDINEERQTVTVTGEVPEETPTPEEPETPGKDVDLPETPEPEQPGGETPEPEQPGEETPAPEQPGEETPAPEEGVGGEIVDNPGLVITDDDVQGEVVDNPANDQDTVAGPELADTGFNLTSTVVIAALVLLLLGGGLVAYQRFSRRELQGAEAASTEAESE